MCLASEEREDSNKDICFWWIFASCTATAILWLQCLLDCMVELPNDVLKREVRLGIHYPGVVMCLVLMLTGVLLCVTPALTSTFMRKVRMHWRYSEYAQRKFVVCLLVCSIDIGHNNQQGPAFTALLSSCCELPPHWSSSKQVRALLVGELHLWDLINALCPLSACCQCIYKLSSLLCVLSHVPSDYCEQLGSIRHPGTWHTSNQIAKLS